MKTEKLKPFPHFKSDKEAEDFVDNANLADYDLSGFKRTHFEFEKKSSTVTLRVPARLLDAVKARAKERQIPYQRLIREAMEMMLQ
jgi:predicted DNA binding CopG/RHH family protein